MNWATPRLLVNPLKRSSLPRIMKARSCLMAEGKYLYCLITDRLFVYNTWQGGWGEIIPPYTSTYPIKGLVLIGGKVAVYGDQGLWITGNKYSPDVFMNKNPVTCQQSFKNMAGLNQTRTAMQPLTAVTSALRVPMKPCPVMPLTAMPNPRH